MALLVRRADESGVPLLVARVVVGGMFIWTGISKILEPIDFLKLLLQYRVLPDDMPWVVNSLAVGLPYVEVVCGILLLAGVAVRGTSLLLLGMLVAFTAAVIWRALDFYAQGGVAFCSIKFDCGCGTGEQYVCMKLPENLLLILLSLIALLSRSRRYCLLRNLVPGPLPFRIEGY
jgi:uncharacterized membrane protein YphA (DoxX/SURF4 family)